MAASPTDDVQRDGLFSFLSRRRFLKVSLVAGGAVLGVGGGGLLALRGSAPKVQGLRVLDAHEYRTLQSLVEVMLPKTDVIPIDSGSMDLPRAFDDFLANEPEHNVKDLQKALVLVELYAGSLQLELGIEGCFFVFAIKVYCAFREIPGDA